MRSPVRQKSVRPDLENAYEVNYQQESTGYAARLKQKPRQKAGLLADERIKGSAYFAEAFLLLLLPGCLVGDTLLALL